MSDVITPELSPHVLTRGLGVGGVVIPGLVVWAKGQKLKVHLHSAAPPAAPSGLSVFGVSSSELDLSWTDNATNESGFLIQRSLDGSTWSDMTTVGANVTTYANTGLAPSTTYYYRVRAYNAQGSSAWSNTASGTTQAIPGGFTVSAGGNQTITEGTAYAFPATISGGTAPYTYYWNYGDSNFTAGYKTALNQTHTYDDNGSYAALALVMDSAGHQALGGAMITASNVAPTVTIAGRTSGAAGTAMNFMAIIADPSVADFWAGFTYAWDFGDTGTGIGKSPTHTYISPGTYTVSVTATDKDGGTGSASVSVTVTTATVVTVDSAWLTAHGPAPYRLTQAGAIYTLATDVTVNGTAFQIAANNITFDLGGHTITYDNNTPMTVPNGDFESGSSPTDIPDWDVSQAPAAIRAPAMANMWGSWMLQLPSISSAQTLVSSPVAIPAANQQYVMSITTKGPFGSTVAFSVVDSVTSAVLATRTDDPGLGASPILKFTPTTTNAVVMKLVVTPQAGHTATVNLDDATISRSTFSGVDLSYTRGVTVTGGSIIEGTGQSYSSSPILAYSSSGMTVKNVTATAGGMDTNLISANYSADVTVTDCNLTAQIIHISNRTAGYSIIYLMNTHGFLDIENNQLSGTAQSGIGVTMSAGSSYTNIVINGNDIRQDSSWTDGYGIALGIGVANFEVSNNTIIPVNGRGIILDTSASGIKIITNGSIHDNTVQVQERPDLEYGQTSLEATGLRMRNWSGTISNLKIYNNTFAAYTGVGLDWAAIGARISCWNTNGVETNANLVFQNNTFKAIVVEPDPGLVGSYASRAWGLTLSRVEAGTGITFIDNTVTSNDVALNFGDNDAYSSTEQDITLIGTSVVKASEGATLNFSGISLGDWGNTVHNIRMIDTTYGAGVPTSPKFIGTTAKDVSFGYTLNLTVVDAGANPQAGANVTIRDQNGNLAYAGTTNSQGLISTIPLLTTTSSVAVNGNNSNPTITTLSEFTITATSGSKTNTQSINLTSDQSLTLTVQ